MFNSHRNASRGRLILLGVPAIVLAALIGGCPITDQDDADTPVTGDKGLTGKFVGAAACAVCHTNTHNDWSKTLHATALETLEAIGQDTNPTCLACHTVGFGVQGGFVDRATTNSLAGVGCENCHGAGRDHIMNVADKSLRPPVDISSAVCGQCHTGEHQPNFDEWQESGHAEVHDTVAEDLVAGGFFVEACGQCHSGTVNYLFVLEEESVASDMFAGMNPEDLLGIQCANCHNPHRRTGNAVDPGDGRDFQLRFPEVATPTPTNTIAAATDSTRFNLCGQCHHSRGRDWTATSRGPHHSVQTNVFVGEMPVPLTDPVSEPLVLSRLSVHRNTPEQCATCHMYRKDFESEQAPAIAGHSFEVNTESCSLCHASSAQALVDKQTLQSEIQTRLDDILARLGDSATWQYSAEGGPADQSTVSDEIKKVRFLYEYVANDGSLGMHNPAYVRSMLEEADELLVSVGK